MDWRLAIRKHRSILVPFVTVLVGLLIRATGLTRADILNARVGDDPRMARHHIGLINRILVPLESAVRRLVVVFEAHLLTSSNNVISRTVSLPAFSTFAAARPRFKLVDRYKRFGAHSVFVTDGAQDHESAYDSSPSAASCASDISAVPFVRRLCAVSRALDDLPAQARRLRRLLAQRKSAKPGKSSVHPVRPGFAPGWRRVSAHDVDDALRACHALVRHQVVAPP